MPIGPDNIRGFGIPNPPNPNPAPIPPPVPPVGPGQPGQPRTATITERARWFHDRVPEGASYATNTAFPVNQIYVQNFSNQYAFLVEAQRFLVPWEVGAIIPGNGQQSVTIRWEAPQGLTQQSSPVGSLYYIAFERETIQAPGLLVPASAHP